MVPHRQLFPTDIIAQGKVLTPLFSRGNHRIIYTAQKASSLKTEHRRPLWIHEIIVC